MIQDLKELQKLLKLCRAQGVLEIEFDNVKLKLGDLPIAQSQEEPLDKPIDDLVGLDPDFGVDQMAFYSSPPMDEHQ